MSAAGRRIEWAYAAGWRLLRILPGPLARALFRAIADTLTRRRGVGVQRLAGNLRRVVGPDLPEAELQALVRAGMRSYLRYYLEAFRLPGRTRAQHRTDFALERGELLGLNVAAGRGSIVALTHGGNWDAAGAWVAAMGWPITTVAERLKPEGLYRRFLAFREGLGMRIIPSAGADRSPLEVLAEVLGQGHVVPLLADRDLSTRGVEVSFFGGRARMAAGPAVLALRTGAPLYVAHMWYEPAGPRGYLEGPLELPDPDSGSLEVRVRALTQTMADLFAAGIARHPQDWHMLQRMWLADPVPAASDPVPAAVPDPGR